MSDVQNHNPISLLVVLQIDQNLILRGGDVTVMTAALSDGFKNPDHFTGQQMFLFMSLCTAFLFSAHVPHLETQFRILAGFAVIIRDFIEIIS